jgi:predicted O-methyltransferase YrrM
MEFRESLAKYFKVRGIQAIGNVDKPRPRGRWALAMLMADKGFQTGVEIGTQYGDSAEIWCSVNPQLKLTCVDPYGDYRKRHGKREQDAAYQATCERLSKFGVTMKRNMSLAVVDEFQDGSLDFVHIDGDHSFDAAIMDIVAWAPKVRKGGLVIVHDYFAANWLGVTQAVDAYIHAHQILDWYVASDETPTAFWEKV